MTDHLPDVELTDAQDARATALERAVIERPASAACLIVHLQDRIAELQWQVDETARRNAIHCEENARLQDALRIANANHERFEREWYLRGDRIAELEAQAIENMAERNGFIRGQPELISRICHGITGICVRVTDPERGECTPENCAAMRAAVTTDGTPR